MAEEKELPDDDDLKDIEDDEEEREREKERELERALEQERLERLKEPTPLPADRRDEGSRR